MPNTSAIFSKLNIANMLPDRIKSAVLATFMHSIGIVLFLLFWQVGAHSIKTSLGDFPGPKEVLIQSGNLIDEYKNEKNARLHFMCAKINAMLKLLLKIRRPTLQLTNIRVAPLFLTKS